MKAFRGGVGGGPAGLPPSSSGGRGKEERRGVKCSQSLRLMGRPRGLFSAEREREEGHGRIDREEDIAKDNDKG